VPRAARLQGIRFYDFEFAGERLHEVRTLCVYRGKLWSLDATTTARNWPRRQETYTTIQDSFMPRL
jgi:hypothetical protein